MPRSATLLVLSMLAASAAPLAAQSLMTTFTSNNGGNVGGAVHLDMTVLNPAGIVIDRLDINCANPRGTPAGVDLYMTALGGTHVGNQQNPLPGTWHLRASGSLMTAGQDAHSTATLDKPVALAAGTYGVTLAYRGCATRYTNAATNLTFANPDLQLNLGSAQNTPFVTGIFQPRIANCEVFYAPIVVDVADFTVDVVSGSSPLQVNFTDRSQTVSGPISAWAWDFEDDGIVDSTLQNPTHFYAQCGDYDVELTITTPAGNTSVVWPARIEVDPLEADFTATPPSGPPPLVNVQFTDTSSGSPQSWAWDFDSDGVPEATTQNATWSFGPGAHAVTLTVTNGCRVEQVTQRITAATHTFATGGSPNSFINLWGIIMFDLAVTSTEALSICAIDCRSATPAGNLMEMEFWLTDGTALGKENMPGEWRHVASGSCITPGGGQPAPVILDRPILLLPGHSYGVGVYHKGNSANYVNLTAPIVGADLTLTPVGASYVPNGPFVVTTLFAPRQWIGEIHYLKEGQFPQAGVTWFGPGCPGSFGVTPNLAPVGTSRPLLGTTTTLQVDNLANNAGIMMLGLSNTFSPFGPLPVDLSLFGMPGCTGRVSPDANSLVLGAGGIGTFSLTLPMNPVLAGTRFFNQVLVLDAGFNAFGAVVSDAVANLTGSF